MKDPTARHFVAFIASAFCALAYFGGYFSGQFGWWWTVFAVLIVYGMVYHLIDK